MNVFSLFVAAALAISTLQCHGQVIHERETFSGLTSPQVVSDTLPGPQYMRERVADGKLRLTLRDAIVLTLMNNMEVRVQELNVETQSTTSSRHTRRSIHELWRASMPNASEQRRPMN